MQSVIMPVIFHLEMHREYLLLIINIYHSLVYKHSNQHFFNVFTLYSASSSGEAAQRIGGYLDALGGTGSALSGGAGISSHVNNLGSSTAISGTSATAVKSYLDNIGAGSAAVPSAPAVKNMMDSVSAGVTSTGSGIASYLEAMPVTNARVGGAGIPSHVNALVTTTQLSGAGIPGYLESMSVACEGSRE